MMGSSIIIINTSTNGNRHNHHLKSGSPTSYESSGSTKTVW
jgi:hypothetical protein